MQNSSKYTSPTPSLKTEENRRWRGTFFNATNEADQLKKILCLRVLLMCSLIAAAMVCSFLSYMLLSGSEVSRFTTQYNSISESALYSVADSFVRTNTGLKEMASTYSYIFPNASSWPEVAWPGFDQTATLLGQISSLETIAFTPIVRPDQLPSFEAYMKDYYETFPSKNMVGTMPGIKRGEVWALTKKLVPYHDVTGYTPYSNYTILTPVTQFTTSAMLGPQYLSLNLHATDSFTVVLDQVLECSMVHNATIAVNSCGMISESMSLPFPTFFESKPPVEDVQAMLAHPIFPAYQPNRMVGYMTGALSWKNMLIKAVPTFVSGLDCVITSGTSAFTYSFVDGVPVFRGLGDKHDPRYNSYRRAKKLDTRVAQISSVTAYEIAFYPRREFYNNYTSDIPIVAAVLLVMVFLFCGLVFLFYDILMKREFGRKQAVLDTKRRFVRFISHEIRTPLNTVRLGLKVFDIEICNLAVLVRKTPLNELAELILTCTENWRHLADDIASNSESAVEVLDDLLNYDKIEVGSLRLELCFFNVWEMVRRTTSIMKMQAKEKEIQLELTCNGDCFNDMASGSLRQPGGKSVPMTCIVGDTARMGQVLRNLISNAIKFTPTGGYISVTAKTIENGMPDAPLPLQVIQNADFGIQGQMRAGSIQISVKDSGAGLTRHQLTEICTEGVQFNANELQAGQGSGLGLFIAKGLVEQHGGKLSVTSEGLGKGVTFTVELPLYHAPLATFGATNKPNLLIRTLPTPTSDSNLTTDLAKHTLVVDDSPFNRKMLVRLLTSKGYECEQAENGEQAIRVFQDMNARGQPLDAITMDFEMPVMNGPTATAKLRELGCQCLIVGVTGNVLPEDVSFFKAQGADEVLVKPMVLEIFEDLLFKHQNGMLSQNVSRSTSSSTPYSAKPLGLSPKVCKLHAQVFPAEEG